MKKIILIITFCTLSAGALFAQGNTTISYSMGFTTGDLSDFIKQASFRGFVLDYRKMVQPNIGIGFSGGWNVFYEEFGRATYTIDNQTITGKQYRYSNHIPLYINPTYFLKPGESLNPFVTLGVGTIYSLRNTNMNLYTIEEEAWNFALAPEIGVQYSIDDATAVSISGKFNYGFKAGNELNTSETFFTLNVGFTFIN